MLSKPFVLGGLGAGLWIGPRAVPARSAHKHARVLGKPERPEAVGGCCEPGRLAVVRLRGQWDRAVEVRFCAVKSRAVSNRNCVAAMRGGEQRNENDQSVTQVVVRDSRRELDSVGVDGRVFDRKTKPAKRAIGASQIAGQPGGPRSWHRWLETEWSAVPRPKSGRPAGAKRCSWPQGPKNRPAGVRASVVATKRVTTVERRDAGKWMRDGRERRKQTDASGSNA
jgi:hypothetical protein